MDQVIDNIKGFDIHISIDEKEEKMYFYASQEGNFGREIEDESFFKLKKRIIKNMSNSFTRFDVFNIEGLSGYCSNKVFEQAQVTSVDGDYAWVKYYNKKFRRERVKKIFLIVINDETIKLKEQFEKEENDRRSANEKFISAKESIEVTIARHKDFFIK